MNDAYKCDIMSGNFSLPKKYVSIKKKEKKDKIEQDRALIDFIAT